MTRRSSNDDGIAPEAPPAAYVCVVSGLARLASPAVTPTTASLARSGSAAAGGVSAPARAGVGEVAGEGATDAGLETDSFGAAADAKASCSWRPREASPGADRRKRPDGEKADWVLGAASEP